MRLLRSLHEEGTVLVIPLWALVLVLAIPTLWLWCRDRRPPPGFCQTCAYDLTGNESGVCPECGEAVSEPRG